MKAMSTAPTTVPTGIAEYMTLAPSTVDAHQSLMEARELMRLHRVKHLPVLADGCLVGVVTERDVHLALTLIADSHRLHVAQVMQEEPLIVRAHESLELVLLDMLSREVDTAIVADSGGALVGIFTPTHAVRALIEINAQRRPS
ncbi:MAG: CBS domain-containing protein [Bdellovibrionales bacterium]|nr:CBS domain-containing protein [Bdellovibrionales bacterium]